MKRYVIFKKIFKTSTGRWLSKMEIANADTLKEAYEIIYTKEDEDKKSRVFEENRYQIYDRNFNNFIGGK